MPSMRHITRAELLEQINRRFSEAEIRSSARIINPLPADAQLGAICIALGIIPRAGLAEWRRITRQVPVMIADAYVQGIRGYMAGINRTTGRYAGRTNKTSPSAFMPGSKGERHATSKLERLSAPIIGELPRLPRPGHH